MLDFGEHRLPGLSFPQCGFQPSACHSHNVVSSPTRIELAPTTPINRLVPTIVYIPLDATNHSETYEAKM